jgi:AcrR family transcriptional regulator
MFRSLNPDSAHGRQAEARRNDRAVLDAARDVFAAHGADAPISAVAERAGVGMGTLYRRYGSKTELLQRMCVLAMEQGIEAAGEALRADDPWAGLCGYIRAAVEMRSGALGSLAGQIAMTDEMLSTARRGMALAREVVARAHRAGSLRADVTALDIALLIESFSRRAPWFAAPDDPDDPDAPDAPEDPDADEDEERNAQARLLTVALDGLRAPGVTPLPGRAPSAARYVGRWSRGPDAGQSEFAES